MIYDDITRDDDEVTELNRRYMGRTAIFLFAGVLSLAMGFFVGLVDRHTPVSWFMLVGGIASLAAGFVYQRKEKRYVFDHVDKTVEIFERGLPFQGSYESHAYEDVTLHDDVLGQMNNVTSKVLRVDGTVRMHAMAVRPDKLAQMSALQQRLQDEKARKAARDDEVKLLAERADGHRVPDGGAGNAGTPVAVPLFSSTNEDTK